eukprot:9412319-Alexandrium_andersonii.AAC.1
MLPWQSTVLGQAMTSSPAPARQPVPESAFTPWTSFCRLLASPARLLGRPLRVAEPCAGVGSAGQALHELGNP